jgi:ATP-dependent exoDNAse (exonuclease V) alpha subunit
VAPSLSACTVVVDFDGREISYGFCALDELVLAYATTIHNP